MKHFSKKIKPHFITCEDLKTCGTFFTSQDQEDKERAGDTLTTFFTLKKNVSPLPRVNCNDVGNTNASTGFMMDLTSSKSSDLCHWPQSARMRCSSGGQLYQVAEARLFFLQKYKNLQVDVGWGDGRLLALSRKI